MKIFYRLIRLIHIQFILIRYNLDEVFLGGHWFFPFRFLLYLNPWYWYLRKRLTRGERLRSALERLGPIFVKAGQILSTRRDILPDDIADDLSLLQDRVLPFPGQQARKMIEQALGCSIEAVFTDFQTEALASASIAQVHAAKLHTGEAVVIKVLRPHIKTIIERDVDLLMSLATLVERYWPKARSFKPRDIIAEIAQTLQDELDLLREGANASQLRRNFAGSTQLYVPKIHWEYSRSSILVMEHIFGIPIHDIAALKQAGFDLHMLAERSIEIFFTQIFRDSFFHADLHPGNLFIAGEPSKPLFIAVDFGIVGSLSSKDQRYIAENMLAFFRRDYRRVAELHIACGWLAPDTRVDYFEGAIRSVSEPIFERPLRDISFGQLLLRLFQVARRFDINIQPQLILLQKTLISIESLSRQLSPELDLWAVATPHMERWLRKQVGFKAFYLRLKENISLWSEQLPEIPTLIHEVLNEKKQEQEHNRFTRMLEKKHRHLKPRKRRGQAFLAGTGISLLAMSLLSVYEPIMNMTIIELASATGIFALALAAIRL